MNVIGFLSLKRIKKSVLCPQDAFKKIHDVYGINREFVRNDDVLFKSIIEDLDLNLSSKLPAK